MDLIDSHAHLNFADAFGADLEAVLSRASAAGVGHIVTIGTSVASSQRARDLAHTHPQLLASVGIHPHQVDAFEDGQWSTLHALWADDRVRAIGETGLDYFYDYGDRERQRAMFQRHLEAAAQLQMPVVVHIRDAFEDAFAITEAVGLGPAGGIVHCFTGGPAELERALALGYEIGLSGIASFKGARALRRAVPLVPAERLHLETDAPYLAPVPHRGKRNEPAFVADTARAVAALRGEDPEALAATAAANSRRLFKIDS